MTPELITALIALIGAITGYIKVSTDRRKTAEKRDSDQRMLEYRINICEKNQEIQLQKFDALYSSVKNIEISMAKMSAFFEENR